MHELGHCFDLAHTPKGIMGRGFDDMNRVWTMWRKPSSLEKDLIAESVKPGQVLENDLQYKQYDFYKADNCGTVARVCLMDC